MVDAPRERGTRVLVRNKALSLSADAARRARLPGGEGARREVRWRLRLGKQRRGEREAAPPPASRASRNGRPRSAGPPRFLGRARHVCIDVLNGTRKINLPYFIYCNTHTTRKIITECIEWVLRRGTPSERRAGDQQARNHGRVGERVSFRGARPAGTPPPVRTRLLPPTPLLALGS